MNRWCVTGGNGLLGTKLIKASPEHVEWLSLDIHELSFVPLKGEYVRADITSKAETMSLISRFRPEVVFHTAALTHVDECETNRDRAWDVNVSGAENVAEACRACGASMIHLSTDYVFDGRSGPYDEEAGTCPLNYYGTTKLESEVRVSAACPDSIIARSMVLYGYEPHVRPNFAMWVIGSLLQGRTISVVTDQMGNPTLADDLASGLIALTGMKYHGVLHTAGGEWISRFDFAKRLAGVFTLDDSLIREIKTSELELPASRPLLSGLKTDRMNQLGIHFQKVDSALRLMKLQMEHFGAIRAYLEENPEKDQENNYENKA
ncbi:MAG TPA: dTDP-4-dehydrorhamnose reductase [bacterium]|nr:dTDP-4-dehydrorhamnose reductase [bacterium]